MAHPQEFEGTPGIVGTWELVPQVCAPFQYNGGTEVEAYLALVCPGHQLVESGRARSV